MSEAIIDPATFAELQETAGADFVNELVQTFLEEAPAMLQELRDALASGNAEDYRRAAHSLKSNSLTFGARTLGAMAREQELGGLPTDRSPAALDALAQEYTRVAAALTELCHD
ncbi:FOG: HPt domain [Variovorax sp. HW608]|uniref:Hpt domain-containing protein n=1 Tax=Variovorax sp. HW608 TaxID=1034889 RepID=UPI00081FB270|nr:Hpt domain-containing protein [Variovorax sp. HW608]SCK24179.1 FOG: HPt domain [Variovorax sp. HW608]